jgi:hypothetical protein
MTPEPKNLTEIIARADRQRGSQDGNHVVLEGWEWDVLLETLRRLRLQVRSLRKERIR